MSYIYRLAGENLKLAEAELNSFLKSQGTDKTCSRDGRLAETEEEPKKLKRLALIHEVCRKKAETETKDPKPDIEIEGTFKVRCKVVSGDKDSEEIEDKLGEELSNPKNTVNLENPDKKIYAYVQGEKIIIGELIQDLPRGKFKQRSNEKRPFSSPVSLDPVLARVLVNLSEVPVGGKIIDPFCGTGGILIEAGLCGMLPLGTDVKKEMVEGTRKNLEKYGILNHNIKQVDAEDSLEKFEDIDAIITDLPYGKASKVEGKTEEKFLNLISQFDGKTVFMYDKPELGDLKAQHEIYIHKNLTRYIFLRQF
jgi:tRNA (guanine10-N2)-dimethyltransferase